MADDVFRQSRKKITAAELGHDAASGDEPLSTIKSVQEAVAKETGREVVQPMGSPRSMESAPFEIAGNVPPQFREALMRKAQQAEPNQFPPIPERLPTPSVVGGEEDGFDVFEAPPERKRAPQPKATPDAKLRVQGSDQLEALLQKLTDHHHWEKFEFPSKGRFYNRIPAVVHIRPMTGEEEQILATPRWVKKGKAIDMIFRRCIKEPIDTEELLSVDRTHLLIFLRGISYTPEYDVEIKCPNCGIKFAHVIGLDELDVTTCPDNFSQDTLSGVLPASGFSYSYRLATGQDEQEVTAYRERRIQQWGDQGEDDTLLYRTALLLEDIEGVTMKKELAMLLKKLPIQDVAHLRNEINTPPFGVDTELPLLCPSCNEDFKIDLPLETNFFFPRKKEARTQA